MKQATIGYRIYQVGSICEAMDTAAIDGHEHSLSSFRWVVERGIRVKSIKIRESSRNEIVSDTFEGLYVLSLVCIDLHDCVNVTDASISSLLIGCLELQEIDVSGCNLITDADIVAVVESSVEQHQSHSVPEYARFMYISSGAWLSRAEQHQSLWLRQYYRCWYNSSGTWLSSIEQHQYLSLPEYNGCWHNSSGAWLSSAEQHQSL